MINKINYFFIFLILILPITFITGPAIPDLTITFGGIFFLLYIYLDQSYKKILENNLVKFSILFWFFLLFISFFAENFPLAIKNSLIFIRLLFIPIFLFYCIFINKNYLKICVGFVFLSVIFVCLDSIYQFLNYDPEFGFGRDIFGFVPNWYGRLTGPFYQELIPGAYVSKFGLIGLVFLFLMTKKKINQNIASVFYLTLVGIVTYVSGERMAFATFLLGIFFLIIFYRNKRMIFVLSFISIISVNILINATHPIYNDFNILESTPYHLGLKVEKEFVCKENNQMKCKKTFNLQPGFLEILKNFRQSAYGQIYILGLTMYNDHKFQGIGLNNFTFLCNNDDRYKKLISNYNCVSHPHNIYLQWLVEAGIIGLLFFILYLYFIIKFILLNEFNEYSFISLSTLLILFWPIMSTGSLLKNWNGISTFFIVGICLALSGLKRKN